MPGPLAYVFGGFEVALSTSSFCSGHRLATDPVGVVQNCLACSTASVLPAQQRMCIHWRLALGASSRECVPEGDLQHPSPTRQADKHAVCCIWQCLPYSSNVHSSTGNISTSSTNIACSIRPFASRTMVSRTATGDKQQHQLQTGISWELLRCGCLSPGLQHQGCCPAPLYL